MERPLSGEPAATTRAAKAATARCSVCRDELAGIISWVINAVGLHDEPVALCFQPVHMWDAIAAGSTYDEPPPHAQSNNAAR
jgi:hypothetical protein